MPVRVNQLGYLPESRKIGVIVSDSAAPEPWAVLDARGRVVGSGRTSVHGPDQESGDSVHWADFSAITAPGEGYVLRVGHDESFPFKIGEDAYRKLKYDALAYFYHNRSGVPIEAPYVAKRWTRPAGHLSDSRATCPANRCSYSLDVAGGWYDAGDHGKYVVNGGISAWTLLNLWERSKLIGAGIDDFADGRLSVPERSNGAPDLLDEVRWELEFMISMQVPADQPNAGMVHHKVHDSAWTPLGLRPPAEAKYRFLHPTSTAATLNLAATAAQCARVYRSVDAAFARRCQRAAVRAWNAAQRQPAVFASPMDNQGGGPYDDRDTSDEFYWAAAELFTTFGTPELLSWMRKSPHHCRVKSMVGDASGAHLSSMTWQATAALGTITLLVVPNALPSEERDRMRDSLLGAADVYLSVIDAQGYLVPMRAGTNQHYPWGSNSFVVNNALVLALAHDLTGDSKYLDGVVQGMDYLLGRNPLNLSYVTQYGAHAFNNPHHRFWAHKVVPSRPEPPPGALAGGPNSKLEDPTIKQKLFGCRPQKCYIDDVQSWSVNEVAINWNAPLAWVASFLDEKGKLHGERARAIVCAAPLGG